MSNTDTVYEDRVTITCTNNDMEVEAEIDNFREKESFNAFIAGNKIHLVFNGKVYVGNQVGLEFVSQGPKQIAKLRGRY
ncbi:MAG: hypothetical protein ACKVJK_02755 [Methylophagaceae bacterium]|jgi:hypothetical protein|tara:strand:+ start:1186 stop:1422 length:237 start_codon:yes stop_codon:yes gene_type:complete